VFLLTDPTLLKAVAAKHGGVKVHVMLASGPPRRQSSWSLQRWRFETAARRSRSQKSMMADRTTGLPESLEVMSELGPC
jgi:hypothetical protein